MSENNTDLDDILEFVEISESFKRSPSASHLHKLTKSFDGVLASESDEEPKPRVPVQYSIYGSGYKPTTKTIERLPAGCYNITADQHSVFVTPTPIPTGLLLELPEMKSEEVIKVVELFWDSEKDYKDGNDYVVGGATYKAGVLLYGPPGSGKSCTLKLLAKKLVEKGGIVFYADTSPNLVSQFLSDFAQIEKDRKSIVLFEDIDSLIENYGEAKYLEILDSAKTINNVLFIATTNYPDRLDARIYNRPGRFSYVIKVGLPTAKAREAYLKAVLKNYDEVDYIIKNTENFTIDHLSSLINARYREKKDLKQEIERLKTLFKIPKIKEDTVGISLKG